MYTVVIPVNVSPLTLDHKSLITASENTLNCDKR